MSEGPWTGGGEDGGGVFLDIQLHEQNTETGWEVNKETAAAFRKQWKKRREDVEKKRWTVVNTLMAEDRKKEMVYGRDTEGTGEAI